MRAFITALALAFALGTFATAARADCAAHVKKNDFETPPPASSVQKSDKQG